MVLMKKLPPAPLWLFGVGEAVQAVLVTALVVAIPVAVVAFADGARGDDLAGVGAMAAQVWLVIHGAPLHLDGGAGDTWFRLMPLGFAVIPFLVAWRAGRRLARGAYPQQLWQGIAVLMAGYAAAAVGIAILAEGDAAVLVWAAVAAGLLVAVGSLCGCYVEARSAARMFGMDLYEKAEELSQRLKWAGSYAWCVLRGGVVAAVAAVGLSAVLLGGWLAAQWMPIANAYQELGAGITGATALTLLHLGVVPNLVLWTLAYSTGAGFQMGTGAPVGPFHTEWAAVPHVPVLAALPAEAVPWAVAVVALPVTAGLAAGWWLMREGENHFDEWCQLKLPVRPVSLTVSTLTLGVFTGLVAALLLVGPFWLSHISLGVGRMVDVGPHAMQAAGLLGAWVAVGTVIGYLLSLVPGRLKASRGSTT